MRRELVIAVMASALVWLPGSAADAQTPAASGHDVACVASPYPLSVSPGLTMEPSVTTTFESTAPSVIDCQGSVEGRQVTGRGQVLIEKAEAAGATCQQSSGAGRAIFTVPTAEGTVEFVNHSTYEHTGLHGTFSGPLLSGFFVFSPPTKGDCMSKPLTVVTVTFWGTSPN